MGKTVAFPVIGLGLDAAPLKKGLKEAQGFVKSAKFETQAWGAIGSSLARFSNVPDVLSKASLPINQTLELAGKAQRLLGAPLRAQMALEGSNADVAAGGNRLLGSGTLSGTLARFERSFEDMMANIWSAIDKTFDTQGLIERARGWTAGVSLIIETVFGPVEKLGKDPEFLTKQFKNGALQVVNTFESIGKIAVNIYNGFFEVVRLIREIPGLGGAKEFNKDQEAKIWNWQEKNMVRVADPNDPLGIGRGLRIPGKREDAINALVKEGALPKEAARFGVGDIERIAAEARANIGKLNFNPGPNGGAATAAAKSLEDFTKGLKTGGNALDQINRQYAQDIDAIDKLVNQAGNDEAAFMNANLAYKAAEDKKNMAWLETLKPMMEMQAQSRFSVAFEPNSQALIESMIRAQTGTGSDNPQERVAKAAELQNKMLTEQKTILQKQLEAINRLIAKPGAVFVGGAG